MEHKHEPTLQLDGKIKCRTCGILLPSMDEEIAVVNSRKRAIRILEEIAVAGHYRASTHEKGFMVYAKDKNGNCREEVTAQKKAERDYRVVKRVMSSIE